MATTIPTDDEGRRLPIMGIEDPEFAEILPAAEAHMAFHGMADDDGEEDDDQDDEEAGDA